MAGKLEKTVKKQTTRPLMICNNEGPVCLSCQEPRGVAPEAPHGSSRHRTKNFASNLHVPGSTHQGQAPARWKAEDPFSSRPFRAEPGKKQTLSIYSVHRNNGVKRDCGSLWEAASRMRIFFSIFSHIIPL